jgi:hypothetical protein
MRDFRLYDAIVGAGQFWHNKFTQQCADSGVLVAARNLRKQGAPLATALLMVRALPKR